jgi:predicted DNA binding CopG/RHH family protein
MKKESKASKISSVFNDDFDIDKLVATAEKMTTPSVASTKESIIEPTPTAIAAEGKDRRFTIILPSELYMRMVLKTKTEGISFTKYIQQLLDKDLS